MPAHEWPTRSDPKLLDVSSRVPAEAVGGGAAPGSADGPAGDRAGARTADETDEQAVEQERAEALARLRRGRLVAAVALGVVAALVGVVALLGGFARRTDLLTPVAAGSVVVTGPYAVTFDRATVQHITSSGVYKVVATGTARTTGTTSINPSGDADEFLGAKSPSTSEAQAATSLALGADGPLSGVGSLTPGLPPVPWSATFTFAAPPGDTLLLAVFDLEYTTPYILSDELGWQATEKASTMMLPLERQPDQEY